MMRAQILFAMFLICATASAQAALIDRGGGMIYDDVLNVTWLQNANFGAGSPYDDGFSDSDGLMTWGRALSWADNLVYGGYDDWRLPSMDVNDDNQIVIFCFTVSEEECRDNELAYMFYHNLGGNYLDDLTGDQGPFFNIQDPYWSNTSFIVDILLFGFGFGDVFTSFAGGTNAAAWAVRDGDVAVIPIPATLPLFLSALGVLTLARLRCL